MASVEVVEMIQASRLVRNHNLYPRTRVSSNHTARLRAVLEAGGELPPADACRRTLRVADGFHRIDAWVLHSDDEHVLVPVRLHDFRNGRDLFVMAVEKNSGHGLALNDFDRTRCLTRARELGLSVRAVARALRMSEDRADRILATKTASAPGSAPFASPSNDGTRVPVKPGLRPLVRETGRLNEAQAEVNRKISGHSAGYLADQLVWMLEADCLPANERLDAKLRQLYELLAARVGQPA